MTIKETKDYILLVANNAENTGFSYQVINKTHKVIEEESYWLPQALKNIDQLQEALDLVREGQGQFKA